MYNTDPADDEVFVSGRLNAAGATAPLGVLSQGIVLMTPKAYSAAKWNNAPW